MAFYLALIALLNMSAGFAAAVYLGRKLRGGRAWQEVPGPAAEAIESKGETNAEEEATAEQQEERSGPNRGQWPAHAAAEARLNLPAKGNAQTSENGELVELAGGADLAGLFNREALEAELTRQWQGERHRLRQLIAGMIDLDRFAEVNERLGREAGNRILRAIAETIIAECRGQAVPSRLSGQRFVILFADVELRFASSFIERIRQMIEATRFSYLEFSTQVTLSCAITVATPEDTPETLLERTEAALLEAKRYGRNQTFVYEGRYPTPVMPPDLGIDERTVVL